MSADVRWNDATRSSVRALQLSSFAHTRAYRCIELVGVLAYQRKWPGGLTPIITERWMLFG